MAGNRALPGTGQSRVLPMPANGRKMLVIRKRLSFCPAFQVYMAL